MIWCFFHQQFISRIHTHLLAGPKRPMAIGCGHVFCYQCLGTLAKTPDCAVARNLARFITRPRAFFQIYRSHLFIPSFEMLNIFSHKKSLIPTNQPTNCKCFWIFFSPSFSSFTHLGWFILCCVIGYYWASSWIVYNFVSELDPTGLTKVVVFFYWTWKRCCSVISAPWGRQCNRSKNIFNALGINIASRFKEAGLTFSFTFLILPHSEICLFSPCQCLVVAPD